MDWITDHKIPVGKLAKFIFDWMKEHLSGFFDVISVGMEAMISAILWVLQTPSPFVIIAAFIALAWVLQRSWRLCIGVGLGFLFILNQGYWEETTESLTLILSSCVVCMGLGVPIGIAAAHRPRLYAAMSPVLDLMQTLPTFVYLIPAIVFFGLGTVPGLIATVIFVLPAPIRLTQLGISSTPVALVEAAMAFGATPRQKLWKVELPYALPQIMVGLNQTIMLSLSMVVIAALVGANGLGVPVIRALNTVNTALGFESGFIIVVVAILLDRTLRLGGQTMTTTSGPTPAANLAVRFENVSIVFGDAPQRALPLMDQGLSRAAIQDATSQVLGVHNCSLDVATGEILVLMGLSGSGKSTLLRAVNGLNPVCRGRVEVCDGNVMVDATHAAPETLRRIRQQRVSMVFQQFGLLPWRSVRENVGLGLELAGLTEAQRRPRVDAQLALVNLTQWADRRVGELSGGMQQRVGLARAFATEAPILLMDEPFSALDPLIRARLQDELLDLQASLKRTIIFVSHDLDEAFKLGNRIALMEGGRIVQIGTAREIIANPVSDYVADFVTHMNPMAVLRAMDVMQAGASSGAAIDADAPVKQAMEMIASGAGELCVTRAGQPVGVITSAHLMARLVKPRA